MKSIKKEVAQMKKIIAITLSVIFLLSLAACGATNSVGSMDAAINESYKEAGSAATNGFNMSASETADYAGSGSGSATDGSVEEKIIKTVELRVETKEYDAYVTAIRSAVTAANGYVEDSSLSDGSNTRYASFTFRIPAESLDAFLAKAGENGKILNQSEKQSNVTLEYVDLESRIKSYTTERDTLLGLLEKATALADVLSIQERLSEVNYEIESYTSQLRVLENRVSYSTVSLELWEVERVTEDATSLLGEIKNELADNWDDLKDGVREFIVWFVGGLPILVPVAVLVVAAVLILRKIIKKRRDKKNIA